MLSGGGVHVLRPGQAVKYLRTQAQEAKLKRLEPQEMVDSLASDHEDELVQLAVLALQSQPASSPAQRQHIRGSFPTCSAGVQATPTVWQKKG